jgi:hypothetical protein
VFPSGTVGQHGALFAALGAAFDVTFVDGEGTRTALAAAVAVGDVPTPPGVPTLLMARAPQQSSDAATVSIARHPGVDARLRGLELPQSGAATAEPLMVAAGARVLANGPAGPLWAADGDDRSWCALALPPLAEGERLKHHLRVGRFLALAAITQFLRGVTGYGAWERPQVRATITFDDPNLHWPTYGFLRFAELAEDAARVRYHVGIATVPLDAYVAHRSAVAVFRTARHLSLVVHGNNHLSRELAETSESRALGLAAQSLRRIEAFEAKHGLSVGRVMVPPHGECSQTMMSVLRRVGFEAVAYNGPNDGDAVVGWAPADGHVGGGLPGLHRVTLGCHPGEFALRAFLDQPLCLLAHHDDIADGLDVLANAVQAIGAICPTTWQSLASIARSNYWHRVEDNTLRVRMHTRRAVIDVPDGVDAVVLEASLDEPVRIGLDGRAQRVEVHLPPDDSVDAQTMPSPAWRPWPVVRRAVVEGRDRVLPVVRTYRWRRPA